MKHLPGFFRNADRIAFASFLLLFFSFSIQAQDQQEIDSLEKLLPKLNADSSKLDVLNELSAAIVDIDPSKSIKYAEEAYKLAETNHYQKRSATSLHNIGNGHFNQAEFKTALFYYMKSLHIQESIGNKSGILSASGSIGNVLLNMQQPDEALKYFEKSLALGRELNRKVGVASSIVSMGIAYSDKHDYKRSLEYTFEALKLFEELGYTEAVATCQNNIADSYQQLKDYPKAMVYVTKAYESYESTGNTYGMALALNNLGDFYSVTGNPEKSLEYYKRGLEMGKKIDAAERIIASYKGIYTAYKKLGKYKEALASNEAYQKMNDSIYNKENSKQIAEMQARYEAEKKEKEIDLLTKDNKIREDELIRQRFISWSMAIGGLLVLLLAVFAVRANILKRRTNKELAEKNEKIETAYNIIEDQHKDITDSIRYAERLQNAILPTAAFSTIFGTKAFCFYKPKDIVSGDFFWVQPLHENSFDQVLFAAVDCTGHGVPGAFMSIVGHSLLKQAVKEHHKTIPSDILNELNIGLSETLRQKEDESTVKDGMDMALCLLERKPDGSASLRFSGANNPLWIIRKNKPTEVEEIKGDKFPVGIFLGETLNKFSNHSMELSEGDQVYVFTDGYADQFGGDKGKKFKYKPMQKLLLGIKDLPMDKQRDILGETLMNWKGNLEQVDDILVIGIRI
jgi:serine phosphatase RsbU (regulator of sigma subunit)